jgi:hypothetical protein
MNALPETFINLLQVHVSLKRIGKYLQLTEVAPVPPLSAAPAINTIAVQSANITWPHDRSADSSAASTPRHKFMLVDLALKFPEGQLSLVCGKLGSGKTLLLLGTSYRADFGILINAAAMQLYSARRIFSLARSFVRVHHQTRLLPSRIRRSQRKNG